MSQLRVAPLDEQEAEKMQTPAVIVVPAVRQGRPRQPYCRFKHAFIRTTIKNHTLGKHAGHRVSNDGEDRVFRACLLPFIDASMHRCETVLAGMRIGR